MTTPLIRSPLRRYLLAAIALAGVGGIFFFTRGDRGAAAKAGTADANPITVKAVHPRRDPNFRVTVDRPADVDAYYRANIEAQVAGEVKWIKVARGTPVKRGDLLVRVAVPDKDALMHEKQNEVAQRQREYDLMLVKRQAAEVAVKTAEANVVLKKSLLSEAKAQTKYREVELRNANELFLKKSIEEIVRDQAVKNLEYAQASEGGADAARIKAQQEVQDALANVKVCAAEVERVKQLIEVAKSELEYAAAIVGYAEVKAPFDGAVVSRHVDPGSFVQNASTGHPTPLLTLERSDIVTVVMRVPDNYAPFINSGTEAIIELDSLPGLAIHGKVTRFAPSLVTEEHDRTMRVEVDLWNEAADKYQPFFADKKNLAELKDGPLPLLPSFSGRTSGPPPRLIPGMYGKMTLVLQTFGQVDLIPSQALIRQGGKTYVYIIRDGKSHLIPVETQVDDGTVAYVLPLGQRGEVLGPLPETETVIISNQEELSEGQPVTATLREDWGTPGSNRASK